MAEKPVWKMKLLAMPQGEEWPGCIRICSGRKNEVYQFRLAGMDRGWLLVLLHKVSTGGSESYRVRVRPGITGGRCTCRAGAFRRECGHLRAVRKLTSALVPDLLGQEVEIA
jgi:hypothetical protein